MNEIDDLDKTIHGGTDKRRSPRDMRVANNRARKQERAAETRTRNRFYAIGGTPSLPKFKCLED